MKLIRFLLPLLAAFVLSGCQAKTAEQLVIPANVNVEQDKGVVVLLHGLWRNNRAMRPVERYLAEQGYEILNLSYPSTEFDIPTLVNDYLAPAIDALPRHNGQPLHFVTHSMGGILVRYYLQQYDVNELGRVVMIAPPNNGSELVNATSGLPFSDPSPATLQLSAAPDSWVNKLGPVEFELGVIAGSENNNVITDMLLPGPDDGVVSVASTQVQNMQDFVTVPAKHYHLRANITVLQQAAHFLKFGRFYRGQIL